MRQLLWILTILGTLIGGFFLFDGLIESKGAPQQAAAAAVALGFAALPYCCARAVAELQRIGKEPREVIPETKNWDARWKS